MKKIAYTFIFFTLLLTACSGDNSQFQKGLKDSISLMNDMEYEQAIETLDGMLEKLEGDRFQQRRTTIVYDLIDEAKYMQDHIETLTAEYEEAISIYKQMDKENIESVAEAYQSVQSSLNYFENMSQLDMYKELVAALEDVESIAEAIISSTIEEFNAGFDELDFAKSETALNDLSITADALPSNFPGEIRDTYYELVNKLEEEKIKYVQLPLKVTKWEKEIASSDLGTVNLIGARATNDTFEVFVRLDGSYAKTGTRINMEPSIITRDGQNNEAYHVKQINYKDYTLLIYSFNNYDGLELSDLVRLNVNDEKDMRVEFDGNEGETVDIAAVKAITGTFTPNISLEKDDYTIHVNEIEVTNQQIEISGTVEASKDINLKEIHSLFLPVSYQNYVNGFSNYPREKEFYQGTNTEFSEYIDLKFPITKEDDEAVIHLFGTSFAYNFLDEKEVDKEDSSFILNLPYRVSDVTAYYNQSLETLVKNQDKKSVDEDSLIFTSRYSSNSYFKLHGNYNTFTTTLHILEEGLEEDFEGTEIEFYSLNDDEEVLLHSETLKKKHKAKDISFDVKDVDQLVIKIDTPFFKRNPGIILEKPYVK